MRTLLPLLISIVPAQGDAPLLATETFDAAWSIVERRHFDPSFNGVDWVAVRDELRPLAEAAADKAALRQVIGEMLGRLGQSHFALVPSEVLGTGAAGSEASPAGTVGLDLRWLESRAVVVRVDAGGPAETAGVRPGWLLRDVDGEPVSAWIERSRGRPSMRLETMMWRGLLLAVDGPVGSSVRLGLADVDGRPVELELERVERDAVPFDRAGLPTYFLRSTSWIERVEGHSVGVLRFTNWFHPLVEPVDAALIGMRACDGIVLDLRGNTGGDQAIMTGIAGHFFAEPAVLGQHRRRDGLRDVLVRPRGVEEGAVESRRPGACPPLDARAYSGPLAIVVDETTGSSSEVFAGGMQALGRARVFGSRTAGAALPASLAPLPNGDSLLFAIAEFVTERGDVLEGDGVRPDVLVTPAREDWAAGRDPALEAACAWIAATRPDGR